MSDLQEDALTIDRSFRANSLTTSAEAAWRIKEAWVAANKARDFAQEDLQREREQMEEHLARVTARLEKERDEARAELTSLRRRVKALRDRANELVEEGET